MQLMQRKTARPLTSTLTLTTAREREEVEPGGGTESLTTMSMSTAPELPGAGQSGGAESARGPTVSREGQRGPGAESARPHRGLRGRHVFPGEPEQTGLLHGPRQHRHLSRGSGAGRRSCAAGDVADESGGPTGSGVWSVDKHPHPGPLKCVCVSHVLSGSVSVVIRSSASCVFGVDDL